MSRRGALVVVVVAGCLAGLGGCSSTATQTGDLGPSATGDTPSGPPGILSGLWPSKSDKPQTPSAILGDKSPDTTGAVSVATQPAEPGPSGEPVAPLATPGLAGDDPNDDLQKGKRYFRANDFGLAEQSFRRAVEKHPRDAESWVDLASAYDRLRRFDLADRAYAQAIRLIGPTAVILNDQGFSYMLRGDYERARRTLMRAQGEDPANPYVRANLRLLAQAYRDGKSVQ
jgi:Tfp pilus assembly protein PilF